jgi:hypothetical protein
MCSGRILGHRIIGRIECGNNEIVDLRDFLAAVDNNLVSCFESEDGSLGVSHST